MFVKGIIRVVLTGDILFNITVPIFKCINYRWLHSYVI